MIDLIKHCFWRDDIDSLAFHPYAHAGVCVIHRRAFRSLLGFDPTAQQCLDYFGREASVFSRAAQQKIARAAIAPAVDFHLTSRDIRRASRH